MKAPDTRTELFCGRVIECNQTYLNYQLVAFVTGKLSCKGLTIKY
jgi:hypothetical protein